MAVSGSTSGRLTELHLTKPQTIPNRTGAWTGPVYENSESDHIVPVVYYLTRNGQLEHPHYMEVPLSSPNGLFLSDVTSRLNALRGNGMSTLYSWSCKRSYKNGFVWQDLSEKDYIFPSHGHEYVLKGSELLPNSRQQPPPLPPPEAQTIAAAESGYNNLRRTERRRRNQSCSSIDYDPNEYTVYKADLSGRFSADAATQTDDGRRRRRRIEIPLPPPETVVKGDRRPMLLQSESTVGNRNEKGASKSTVLMQLISCGLIDCGAKQVITQYRMRVPRGGDGERGNFRYSSYNADR